MKKMIAAVALAAAAGIGVPAGAGADVVNAHAKATFVGAIKVVGKKATLKVRYQCASGEHLWVSAKEMADGAASAKLTKAESSKTAAAWWESHRNAFKCNDKLRTATFSIDAVEKGSKGTLAPGKAWVQFCVTTGKTEKDTKLTLSRSGWVNVV